MRSSGEAGTSRAGSAFRRLSSLSGRKRLRAASKSARNARHFGGGLLVGDEQPHVGAHAVEGDVGHEDWVVSGAAGAGAGGGSRRRSGRGGGGRRGGSGGRRPRRARRRRRGGRAAARPVLDDPRHDHAPDQHLPRRRRRLRDHDGLALPQGRVRPGPHLEPEQRHDGEEQPRRPRDHRERPGLLDRLALGPGLRHRRQLRRRRVVVDVRRAGWYTGVRRRYAWCIQLGYRRSLRRGGGCPAACPSGQSSSSPPRPRPRP